MLIKIKQSFDTGLQKLRWFSTLVVERFRVEQAVIKLLWASDELEKNRERHLREIGERVFKLKDREDADVLKDRKIKVIVKELNAVEAELDELRARAAEIGETEQ